MSKFACIVFALIFHYNASSQNTIPFVTSVKTVKSEILDEERTVTIYHPQNVSGPLSTIYLLDGEWNFEVTQGILDLFLRWSRVPSNIALVSVHNQGKRTFDMTPTEDDARFPGSGGAAGFLKFFQSELIPFVEEGIGKSTDRLLIGHSFGGLFGLYALSEDPDLLDGVVAISPSTWYGSNFLMREAYAKRMSKLEKNKFVFISTGQFDGGNVPSNKAYFDWLLKQNTSLDAHYELYEGRNHFSNVLSSTDEALTRYYPGPELETQIVAAYEEGGLNQLKNWYKNMVEKYQGRLSVPSAGFLTLSTQLNAMGNTEEAIALLHWLKNMDDQNGNLYYYLGAFNQKMKRISMAKKNYQLALEKNLPERTKIVIRRSLEKLN